MWGAHQWLCPYIKDQGDIDSRPFFSRSDMRFKFL